MNRDENHDIKFRGVGQIKGYEILAQRDMHLSIYPDSATMDKLGIRESVMFLLNEVGWSGFAVGRRFSSYRSLTLEFLSSFSYHPEIGKGFRRGLINFRMFGIDYTFNNLEMANLLGFPSDPHTFTSVEESTFPFRELDYFWGKISGEGHAEFGNMYSENIHNPAFRYFHKILAHTLFGKEENNTSVSREELFIMLCASQSRPVNGATFMMTNMYNIALDCLGPILVGGLVTMIADALGLRVQLNQLQPLGGIRCMDINFCFNRGIIGNLGPDRFDLLINRQVVPHFTLPSHKTSVHDRRNWLYDLEPQYTPLTPPSSPQAYENPDTDLSDADPSESPDSDPAFSTPTPAADAPVGPPTVTVAMFEALQAKTNAMEAELTKLRAEFYAFLDTAAAQVENIWDELGFVVNEVEHRRSG